MSKHLVTPENAPKFWEWLQHRGGIAVWKSINLSNLGASWSTPARTESGEPTPKPSWEAGGAPARIITSAEDVEVCLYKEVRRFHVAVRRGAQGLTMKLTDASSRRLRSAVDKAGVRASYQFDYGTQEAVILAPERVIPLVEFIKTVDKPSQP